MTSSFIGCSRRKRRRPDDFSWALRNGSRKNSTKKRFLSSSARWICLANAARRLIHIPQVPPAHLPLPKNVKGQGTERRQLRVRQHVLHIVDRQRLPLMQADENIALFDACFGGDAVFENSGHFEPAVELAVDFRHGVRRDRGELHAKLAPDDIDAKGSTRRALLRSGED